MEKICWQITVAAFMQPLQYDLRSPAAKDNSITNAATARSNLDAAITMRSANTELQNTIELRTTASEIVAPKPMISTPERKKDDFEALFKRIFRRKITSAKMEKICWQITVAAFMQPLQYDLRSPAAKDNSITNAATARSNLDAAITMRSAETGLQNTIELRATASEIVAPKPDGSRRQSGKKTILKHFWKGFLDGKSLAPKWKKSANKSLSQPSCSHSNTIYEIQLQKTIVLPMQPQHEATLTQPLQCDLQRLSCKHNRTTRNGVGNCSSKTGSRRQSEKKTILKYFLKRFLDGKSLAPKWKKSANKSLSQPSCSHSNTIYEIQLQKTIVLPMQPQHEATLTQPFTLRERSYSCKAQWNSIGNSSTSNTCNAICIAGTILQLQSTMEFHRQLIHQHHLQSHLHCGNDPTVANHNGILSTAHARKTGETPFTMRNRSDHDPNMIRPWSDHTRDRLATVAPQR